MTFCRCVKTYHDIILHGPTPYYSMISSEYEYIALRRDASRTGLKQGKGARKGGTLGYADSAAIRVVRPGRVLILEGTGKAERGIMPVGSRTWFRKARPLTIAI